MRSAFRAAAIVAASLVASSPSTLAQRTQLKPGWNAFTPQQDVQIGGQNALQAKKLLPMCNDPKVDAYLTQLGMKLVAHLPTGGVEYPWEFHCVNDKAINAFALPGGFVFVNRGAIEAADNESQLAGIMAHELSHVALRHGTNQATKARAGQLGIGILGAILGGSNMGAAITELSAFGASSVLLKYSRTAETQADVLGTQVLYDSGYDPRGLAQFFEKLQAEGSHSGSIAQFFSDHPSPDNRIGRVDEEIERLGGVPANARRDAAEFQAIKREVLALPVPPKKSPGAPGMPVAPSRRLTEYQGSEFALRYPDNWKKYGEGSAISLAPEGGIVQDRNGQAALAYGMMVNMADAHQDSNVSNPLEESTNRLIDELQHANPGMRVLRKAERVRLNGQPALATYLSNDSPLGGQETDWVITVLRQDGLLYFICVAPQSDYGTYDKTFTAILDSVRFAR